MGYGLCQRRAPAASIPDDQKPGYNRALWCRVLSGDGCGEFRPIIPVRRAWVYGVWRILRALARPVRWLYNRPAKGEG